MAIETVDFPIQHGGSFHSYVNVITRGYHDGKPVSRFEAKWAVFKIILSFHFTDSVIGIPRSWMIVIPKILASMILIINPQRCLFHTAQMRDRRSAHSLCIFGSQGIQGFGFDRLGNRHSHLLRMYALSRSLKNVKSFDIAHIESDCAGYVYIYIHIYIYISYVLYIAKQDSKSWTLSECISASVASSM